jgi:hypothetical protein
LIIVPAAPQRRSIASPVFVGREAEVERLERGLRDVPLATIAGIAGVGKSALAQRFAARWSGPVVCHHVRAGAPAAELLDDLRRSLAPARQGTPELATDGERLSDLAERLDRAGALAVIEDADRLGRAAGELLDRLASLLGAGRVVATSRTRLHEAASGPDRVEIVLGGLDLAAAGELWARLDDLYGPRAGFDVAWQRTRGNPFYLRRAHAGDLDADDPVAATVAALDPDQRRIALALALIGMPFPRDLALHLLPQERATPSAEAAARDAIRGLIAALVVEPAGRGHLLVHDLLGEGLCAAATADEQAAAHRAVAGALEAASPPERSPRDGETWSCTAPWASLGLIATTRLRVRHMVAAGMIRPARDLLLARAPELVRSGGAGELLRGLDLVTSDDDGEARLARARAMARMLDLDRAYHEVVALGADREDAGDQLRATFAHLAMLTLRLDVAERVSRAGLLSPSVAPELRIRFAMVHVLTATFQGKGGDARSAIDRAAGAFPTPMVRGCAALSQAFSLWLEERDAEAERAMHAAEALFQDALAFRARVLAPTFMVSVLARAGKMNDAAAALREAESALARFDDPLMRESLRGLRTTLLESEGQFAAARDEAAAVQDAFARSGQLIAALWMKLVRGRVTLYCGQVAAGRRLLEEVAREAEAAGASLMVELADRAGRADPGAAITGSAPLASSRPGEQRRNRVVAVLRSIAAGQPAVARGYLAAVDREEVDPLERALLRVAHWALAGGVDEDADRDVDAEPVRLACEQAARAGADPELVPSIAAWLRDRLVARTRSSELVVVDRRSDTVRARGGQVIVRLGRRTALRRLFYALVEAPDHVCDRAALARAIWAAPYRPAHDGALWVNVKRLRALLVPTGLRIASSEEGVRLRVEPDCELRVIAP